MCSWHKYAYIGDHTWFHTSRQTCTQLDAPAVFQFRAADQRFGRQPKSKASHDAILLDLGDLGSPGTDPLACFTGSVGDVSPGKPDIILYFIGKIDGSPVKIFL